MKFNSHNKQSQLHQLGDNDNAGSKTPLKSHALGQNERNQESNLKRTQTDSKKSRVPEQIIKDNSMWNVEDSFVRTPSLSNVVNLVLQQLDGRIKVIEENQNKIANSLSRFLDKMNSLLFKGKGFQCNNFIENVGKKGSSELDSVSLNKAIHSSFVEDIMLQVNLILNSKSLLEPMTVDSYQHGQFEIQKMQTNPNKDTRNLLNFNEEHDDIDIISSPQQLQTQQMQKQKSTTLNRSYSSSNQEAESEASQQKGSYHSRKETPPLDQVQVKYQQSKNSNSLIKSINGPLPKKSQQQTTHLSSSNSQTSFQNNNYQSRPQTSTQTQKNVQMKQIETNPSNIDFYPKDIKQQNQTTRSKVNSDAVQSQNERNQDKSRTRQQTAQVTQRENRDKERPKSTSRPQQLNATQTRKEKLEQTKKEDKVQAPERKQQMTTQKSSSNIHNKKQPLTNLKPETVINKNRSPRDHEYSSQIAPGKQQYQNPASPKQQKGPANKKPNLDLVEELQKPSKEQIQNHILVEDQAQQPKTTLKDLTGDILDCITDFTGEEFPKFIFCNKLVLGNFLNYQNENIMLQQEMINEQIEELKQENPQNNGSQLQFLLPEELLEKQQTLDEKQSWEKLLRDIATNKLSLKELTVLRIFFTFLGHKNTSPQESDNQSFIRAIQQVVKKNLQSLDKIAKPLQHIKGRTERLI